MMRVRALILAVAIGSVGCSSVAPNAGEEAVLVDKPWFFGKGGVRKEPIKTGLEYVAFSTEAVIVNVQPQMFKLNIDDMMSRDGVPLDFAATITVRVNDSVKLVSQFGLQGFYERNIEQTFLTAIRDAVKKRGMNEVAIDASAAEAIDAEVSGVIRKYLAEKQIPIDLIDINVGKANPPDAVKHQRVATAEQEQRQQTERQAKLAEDARLEHERSRAAADNAYRQAMGFTPEQYIQLQQMATFRDVCAKNNCTFVNGNPNGTMFTVK